MSDTNEYEQERRGKLQKLREIGVDPYGQRTEGISPLATIKSSYKPEMGHDGGPTVKGAGRVMFCKRFGKLSFLTIRDDSGDIQIALDKKRLSELEWQVQDLIDLGDLLVVSGALGTTKTGEVTIWAKEVSVASKALLPPPGKYHGLEDVELRYRQRYVDLWANPEVMQLAKLRIRMVQEIRNYLTGLGYVEVETPMMQPIAGGAAARPFETHHNALDIPLYMRIAPELYLKRLLVGGFPKIFELNRNFRNEGISPRHNPEFTMLEAYEAYGSFETMAEMVEGLICHVAEKVFGTLRIPRPHAKEGEPKEINLTRPWQRVRLVDLVKEWTGWEFDKRPVQDVCPKVINMLLRRRAVEMRGEIEDWDAQLKADKNVSEEEITIPEFETNAKMSFIVERMKNEIRQLSPAEQLQTVYEKLIEPKLIAPTFVTHVPSVIIPLARENRDDPFFADVYELAINGVEISPGYTELNDPDVQAKHFGHQVGDEAEKHKVDDDFLTALRYGMPPAGGMGLGIDRLLMMLTGAESIRDVILFPLMRPRG